MGKKAPRIPEESWNRHKEETICLYLDPNSTLDQTMQLMKERYGFQPSKNQYTTKLKACGVAKYATGQTWEYIDKKTKKRKSEVKDSDVVVHGRKRPRHEVEKEIARHVPTVRQLTTVENIPTPDGVSICTPRDLQAHCHPAIYIDNLPWILFKQETQPFSKPYALCNGCLMALKEGELTECPHPEMANILLDRGADVNVPPAKEYGVTALQAAAINGLFRIVVRLLECRASVAAPAAPIHGRTAIDGAAERGRLDILQLLLNAYAGEEDLRDVCRRAARYAEKEGHVEIAEWLGEYPGIYFIWIIVME